MAQFRVSWEIDIEAGTAEQAARQALAIQRDPESTATIFEVRIFGPCPVCKCHVVHRDNCRIATRDQTRHIHDPMTIDAAASGKAKYLKRYPKSARAMVSAGRTITKVKGGFQITRNPCVVCGEPPFGDEYACGHKKENA
jgi:hypothetical protein